MTYRFKPVLIAGFLVAAAGLAQAQTAAPAAAASAPMASHKMGMGEHHEGKPGHKMMKHADPARMQAMMARHMAELKTRLQITPAQESAWTTFADAMKPPAAPPAPMDWKAMEKMTTPERIDKMHAMRADRDTEMDKREAATKTFYAVLSPAQQKVFDLENMKMHQRMHGMMRHMMH